MTHYSRLFILTLLLISLFTVATGYAQESGDAEPTVASQIESEAETEVVEAGEAEETTEGTRGATVFTLLIGATAVLAVGLLTAARMRPRTTRITTAQLSTTPPSRR